MDELDVRILRTMGIRPYSARPKDPDALKPGHIAARVGSSLNTVKARIARMEKAGVIAGYEIVPNLRHLGLTGSAYHFGSPSDHAKAPVLDAIGKVSGVLEIHDFLGRGFCIDFTHTDEAGLAAVLKELSGITADAAPIKFYDRDMPTVERALTNLDWRILAELRSDATRSLDDVGDALRVTGRTVRTRFNRMAEEGSFFAVPKLDPSRAGGLLLFEIMLDVEPASFRTAKATLLKRFDDQHVYAYVPAAPVQGHIDVLLFARTTSEIEELRAAAAAIDGVTRAEAWLFRGMHDLSGWLDGAIAQQIARTAAARSA